ncbi:hypothetical protein GA0070624_3887 [Micromonospora rhizosphaerae]|uniref:Uncharacterized protein n=1 Tax=Micromonospora rhizosphaerae TaxID=568872 RepID=A0A1C6SIT6_9ACTN|nr:hypothetical protein [Micromonospora rhizosphaerae]SCL29464.1 hypothetical protein GA0070624_3887 [Micromonospora rhizosphaerae]
MDLSFLRPLFDRPGPWVSVYLDATREVRADAALLRAIVGTGARLVLVGRGEVPLNHGMGAVLRYAVASTATS